MKEAKYSYKNLEAYKESKTLVKQVYTLLKQFPHEEQYALCDQPDDEYLSAENQIGKVASLLSGLRSKRLSPNPQSLSSSNPLIL